MRTRIHEIAMARRSPGRVRRDRRRGPTLRGLPLARRPETDDAADWAGRKLAPKEAAAEVPHRSSYRSGDARVRWLNSCVGGGGDGWSPFERTQRDRKSTRLNPRHLV